jgi:hypothetical protein
MTITDVAGRSVRLAEDGFYIDAPVKMTDRRAS